ncbi:MAG TPA: beta-ketoacyl-[acyl-carrier-protein] synthase family protein [Sulfuricurvum sp.]|nr:beta-ketoacyl-[acyl-carrier-protein] synthase family protein [Sulfuricurvum sp.]
MKKQNSRVYLNAFSCACAAGMTIEEIFETLLSGKSAIVEKSGYIDNVSIPLGKIPSEEDFFDILDANVKTLLSKVPWFDPKETMLLAGSSVGGMSRAEKKFFTDGNFKNIPVDEMSIRSIAGEVQEKFGFKSALSFSTACTSSSVAIDYAIDLITHGLYKTVVVIGADELSRSAVNGFDRLGIASRTNTCPFDIERNGINVAEGIAVLAISGVKSEGSVEILSCGMSSDAYNITHPHPEGEGAKAAMRQALTKAGLDPSQIDYINAHGTGTLANDEIESIAIETIFANKPLVVSTKAVTGHTLGACGALEAAISAMSILHRIVPPCVNLKSPVNSSISHPMTSVKRDVNYVLSNAFGFGGGNVSIVLGKLHAD